MIADYSLDPQAVRIDLVTGLAWDGWGGQDLLTGNPQILGSGFADTMLGDAAANRLMGGAGADTLEGGEGADTLEGGEGDDWLIGGAGADVLVGGAGSNTASYEAAPAAVVVSLSSPGTNSGEAAGDTLTGIQNLRSSIFNDRLVTASGNNLLEGLAGDDTLVGGAGADTLDGGGASTTWPPTRMRWLPCGSPSPCRRSTRATPWAIPISGSRRSAARSSATISSAMSCRTAWSASRATTRSRPATVPTRCMAGSVRMC